MSLGQWSHFWDLDGLFPIGVSTSWGGFLNAPLCRCVTGGQWICCSGTNPEATLSWSDRNPWWGRGQWRWHQGEISFNCFGISALWSLCRQDKMIILSQKIRNYSLKQIIVKKIVTKTPRHQYWHMTNRTTFITLMSKPSGHQIPFMSKWLLA